GNTQVEVAGRGPIGGARRGGEAFRAGFDEVAGRVLHRSVGHGVLQRVGKLDIADRALDLLHVGRHAFVALAADAQRPGDRGAFADLLLPLGADLGQVVGEVEAGARAVGAVDDADLDVRQGQARVDRGDFGGV